MAILGRTSTGQFTAGLTITSDTLTAGMKKFPDDLERKIALVADYFAPRVEAYMRTRAPWTDRTGNARNGLRATPFHEGHRHGVDLYHTVPYGIWLETRWEGRYAVIIPTVKDQSPVFASMLRGLMNKGI